MAKKKKSYSSMYAPAKPVFVECKHCKDPVLFIGAKDPACDDCCAELEKGVIRNYNIHFFNNRTGPANDESPWRANAVRHFEDRFDH